MTPRMVPAPDDVKLLDELIDSETVWVDRVVEARRLADHLLERQAPITVLHGSTRSGKSELIRRWVMPLLHEQLGSAVAYYADPKAAAAPDVPEITIEIWDGFDRWIADGDDAGRGVLDRLVASAGGGPGRRTIVLVIDDQALSRLFQLSSSVPMILEDVHEVPPLSGELLLQALARATARCGVSVSEPFTRALARDVDAAAGTCAPCSELIAMLAFELCRHARPGGQPLEIADYEARGRLTGLLESCVDHLLEALPAGIDPQVAWILLETVAAGVRIGGPELDEIGARFGLPVATVQEAFDWLENVRHLLRRSASGRYGLVPPQLVATITARAQREAMATDRSHAILRQGLVNLAESGALPSEHHFRRIHADRSALRTSPDDACLMLRSALAYESPALPGATAYWLRRIEGDDLKVDVLLEAAFDSRADVRRRAAALMGGFPRSDVRTQLHLLALRDPAEGVRDQALQSLDAMKDDDLRRSLLQEIREPHSPYRIQAIEALRIFRDAATTESLVDIVRANKPGEDADARGRAIRVLARQNTQHSAEALIQGALDDPDPEDREAAARALGSLSDPDILKFALQRLRAEMRPATPRGSRQILLSTGLWVMLGVLGAIAVVANLIVHAILLATVRRWRWAAGVLMLQAAAIGAAFWTPGLFAGLWWFSLLLGILVPVRILLVERLDGRPQGRWRRVLTALLFGASAVTFFMAVPALACFLTRKARRGLALLALQLAAAMLLVTWGAVEHWFAGYHTVAPWLEYVTGSLAVLGPVLWAMAWLLAVVGLGLDLFARTRRRAGRARADAALAMLLRNPVAVQLAVGEDCRGAAGRRLKRVARTLGRELDPALRAAWDSAEPATRRRIFSLLTARRDHDALELLRPAARVLGWRARLRAFRAELAYRLSLWPRPVLLGVALIMYVAIGLTVSVVTVKLKEPDFLQQQIVNPPTPATGLWRLGWLKERTFSVFVGSAEDRQSLALTDLRALATQTRSAELAGEASEKLGQIVTELHLIRQPLRTEVLQTAVELAQSTPEQEPALVTAVGKLLRHPETRGEGLEALRSIGSPGAVAALKTFVESSSGPDLPASGLAVSRQAAQIGARDETEAKLAALETLGRIRTEDSLAALHALSASKALPKDLQEGADRQQGGFDRLLRAQYHLSQADYDIAIRDANLALSEADEAVRTAARHVIVSASREKTVLAVAEGRHRDAEVHLLAALAAGPAPEQSDALADAGLRLTYDLHENLAPDDPRAFDATYRILSGLQPIVRESSLYRPVIDANLAEASLTTGRYSDAGRLAREMLGRRDLDPSTRVNMAFMNFAATLLEGDDRAAAVARRRLLEEYGSLPAGFENAWSYRGLRSYITHHSGAPAEHTRLILETVAEIERPKP